MKNKTVEEALAKLNAELSDNMVAFNVELLKTLDIEDYEKASLIRDNLNNNISIAANMFATLTNGDYELWLKKLTEQSAYCLESLDKQRKKNGK